ncbi:MAG: ATP-binding protein, partial [Planctomycetota bacterium]
MKLTDLTIDGSQAGERMQINRMHQGLNVLLDASDQDRNAVAQLIRYLLFGATAEQSSTSVFSARSFHAGHADIVRGPYRFRLSRNPSSHHALQVQGLDNASQIYSGDDLFGKVDAAVFETLYDVDFQHAARQLSEAAVALHQRLGVSPASNRWPTEAAWLAWKQEAEQLKQRLTELRQDLNHQEAERRRLHLQTESLAAQELAQRQLFDRELAELDRQTAEVRRQLEPTRRELEELENRLTMLQAEIDRREGELRFEPVAQAYDGLEVLYGQLDLIDVQLARWRTLQNQIQQQRLELRDEMEQWSKTLETSSEHPYHTAQQALERTNSLTTRIEQAAARIEAETPADRANLKQANAEVRKSCASIRQDLNVVCDELANQYRQLRHKAAAVTMKHLREHYNAIADNIAWLLAERQQTIEEIREVDPVGADAISQAGTEYCELATREGFLAARRKFHGDPPVASGDHRAVRPDLTAERNQLQQWRVRQSELLQTAAKLESQLQQLAERRAECSARRDRYYQGELASLRERLAQLSGLIAGRNLEVDQLARVDAENDRVPPYSGHPLLTQASQLLARLTENRLIGIALAANGAHLMVTERGGQTLDVSSLEPGSQQAALLAVCLATNWWLTQPGLSVPMLLREVLPTADLQQTANYAAVLREFGLSGHQLLVFTRDQQVAEFVAQRLIAGTFSFFKTGRPNTNVGTIPTVTREAAMPPALPAALSVQWEPLPQGLGTVPQASSMAAPVEVSVTPQFGESSWAGQTVQKMARPLHRPVVYSDRSDFRSFPTYRPPVSSNRPHVEVARPTDDTAGIAATIRPLVERARGPISEETSLRSVDLADAIHLNNLVQAGVSSIGDLLKLDPQALAPQLTRIGFSAQQLDRWQAQAWLMLCVEGLTPSDARILVGCGITEPEQLETTSADQLLTRIHRYLQSPDGRRFAPDTARYQLERIHSWHRAL